MKLLKSFNPQRSLNRGYPRFIPPSASVVFPLVSLVAKVLQRWVFDNAVTLVLTGSFSGLAVTSA